MVDISENELTKLENQICLLMSKEPESYILNVQDAAVKILQFNVDALHSTLADELPEISRVAKLLSPEGDPMTLNTKLWDMIEGISLKTNDPYVAAVRAAICATPYPDPQDPQMALEYLVIFSKHAGFSTESIFQALTSSFAIAS